MKDFKQDFYKILQLLKDKTPFAFNRFSDGELFILQNKELVLDNNLVKVGDKECGGPYKKEDFKRFDPIEHAFYQTKLVDSFTHSQKNYFKGLSCRCCVGKEDFDWQMDLLKGQENDEELTWSNLMLNSNYPDFIQKTLPLFQNYKIAVICNENANLANLSGVVKEFRVGYNAMINDYHQIDKIKKWIRQNKIENHLFLFSASSFSKMAIHQLFQYCDKNTYIDIGTTLNSFIGMRLDRSYLKEFWLGKKGIDLNRKCIW